MTHGTVSAYLNHACRCPACREAKTRYMRAYRQARRNTLHICPSCGDFVGHTQFDADTGWCKLCARTFTPVPA